MRMVSLFRPSRSSSRLTKNNLRELRSEAVPGSFPFAPCKVESFPKSLRSPPTFGFSWHSWPVVLKSPFSFQSNRWSEPNRKNRSSLFLFAARYISLIYHFNFLCELFCIFSTNILNSQLLQQKQKSSKYRMTSLFYNLYSGLCSGGFIKSRLPELTTNAIFLEILHSRLMIVWFT
jgi:hypothetical protein